MFSNLTKILPGILQQNNSILHHTLHVPYLYILNYLFFFKYHTNCQFKILTDLYTVDLLSKKKRFIIVYNILSLSYNIRFQLQTYINELNIVSSIYSLYRNSLWYEREIFDMFGIFFFNNPDLRRLLTDYGYKQYPLRKDTPLTGFFEIIYNDKKKTIITKNLNLTQNFRNINYKSVWKK